MRATASHVKCQIDSTVGMNATIRFAAKNATAKVRLASMLSATCPASVVIEEPRLVENSNAVVSRMGTTITTTPSGGLFSTFHHNSNVSITHRTTINSDAVQFVSTNV
jgi:hypothetical protein